MTKRLLLVFVCALIVSVLALGNANLEASAGLFASPQPRPLFNDDFDRAIVIQALPFTDFRDTSTATWSPDDPWDCSSNGSVWYEFTPETDLVLTANTFGSDYDTVLSAYTGTQGALTMVPGACNDDYNGLQSRVTFQASTGTTYYFLIAFCCGSGGNGGGSLVFTVEETPPPPNDDFANAVPVSGIPFTHSSTIEGATLEPGEPLPGCVWDPTGSIWYAFTAPESASVMAEIPWTYFSPYLSVYTGDSLGDLTEIASICWNNRLAFQASAGTTYYIQAGGLSGQTGPLEFILVTAPPPWVSFSPYPNPPSIYDTVGFSVSWSDPAGVGIETFEWDLGDGTTATVCCPSHSYATDGEYLVELVATTYDGRTCSDSQIMQVETHDVAITEFRTPNRARAGETHQIVVSLNNREQYSEYVHVSLFKSVLGGWEQIAYNHGDVPVQQSSRTVDFEFSYTFTDEDALVGKVSFKALVDLGENRDALPADNEVISPSTLIKPLH